jgi:transcriptional regulator with XRE-family HTH domain
MAEPSIFGRRLRALRLRAGLSQGELARRSDIPRVSITLLENGRQDSVSVEALVRLADVLGVSVDMLVRGDVLLDPEMLAARI